MQFFEDLSKVDYLWNVMMAENEIGIFAVSTYITDYILTRKNNFQKAIEVLCAGIWLAFSFRPQRGRIKSMQLSYSCTDYEDFIYNMLYPLIVRS